MSAEHKIQSTAAENSIDFPYLNNEIRLNCDKLNYEEERINSFVLWPVHFPVDPNRLSKAGFYYSGIDDEVICFSCHGHVKNWNYGDVVLKKHADLFPDCDFINNKSNNVPFIRCLTKTKEDSSIGSYNNVLINNSRYNCSINYTKMKIESERLKTFGKNWPLSSPNVIDLVQAGFFYMGIGDKVQCPYCKGIISNWEPGDIPFKEHLKHFPWCEYLVENVIKLKNGLPWFDSEPEDICGNMTKCTNPDFFMNKIVPLSSSNKRLIDINQQHMNLEDLGVHLHTGPAHPQQASLTARLRSFLSWPSDAPVSKEDLAIAGFFYIGIDDHTKCFHCNGGLCNWEESDDPWVEHARWFCNCDFLRLNKGSNFIKSCIAKHPSKALQETKTSYSHQFENVELLMKKVDEAMKSNLVKYVLETELFPSYIVRTAILLQIKEMGHSFVNIDDLCIAASYLKEGMEKEPLTIKPIQETDLSICESISKSCVINDLPEKKDLTSNVLNPVASHYCEKGIDYGSSNNSANASLEEDEVKNHCLCKICMDKEVGVVFLPCGHLLSCTICAPALQSCPMCRKSIQATVRAYLN